LLLTGEIPPGELLKLPVFPFELPYLETLVCEIGTLCHGVNISLGDLLQDDFCGAVSNILKIYEQFLFCSGWRNQASLLQFLCFGTPPVLLVAQ